MLAAWDPAAAVPTLRELTRLCREHYARPGNGHDWTNQNLAVAIARVHPGPRQGGRHRGGPRIRRMGPDDLARLVGAEHPGGPGADLPPARRPDPRRHRLLALRRPAIPLGSPDRPEEARADVPRQSDCLAAWWRFRRSARCSWRPWTIAHRWDGGDATKGAVSVKLDGGFSISRSGAKDVDSPAPGTKVPIRIGDVYAWQLATLEGAPAVQPLLARVETRRRSGCDGGLLEAQRVAIARIAPLDPGIEQRRERFDRSGAALPLRSGFRIIRHDHTNHRLARLTAEPMGR